MKVISPRSLLRLFGRVGSKLDPFFAGRWYWLLKRHIAERRAEQAVDQHGDQSMQFRRAAEECRSADFAFRFWRSAPRPVMQIAEQASKAGIPIAALRLAVLNTDLRIKGGQVYLRRSFMVTVLNTIFATVVVTHLLLMCLMIVLATGPAWLKVLVILAVTWVYCFLYYGWSLYASRPQQVIAEYGHKLDALCLEHAEKPTAAVHKLPKR